MDLFKLFGTIVINSKDAEKAIRKTKDDAESSGNAITNAFKKIGAAVATYFAYEQIKQFGLSCIQAAADAQAMSSQFAQVFGELEGSASESLTSIADNAGISRNRLKGSFTQIAAFAKTTGMETSAALALSERAMIAVADSAAFYDKTLEEVTESLQSFLKGNYENDAALGLSCTEVTRNTAANKLYGKSFQELSEAEKQLTLLRMVEEANAASGALGQAARESGTWTNQIGNLQQAWTDFTAMIGAKILPTAIDVVTKMQETVTWLTKNESKVKGVAVVVGILTAAVIAHNAALKLQAIGIKAATTASGAQAIMMGMSTTTLGLHTVATTIATAATSAFSAVMAFLTSPITLVVTAVGLLTAGIIKLANSQDEAVSALAGTATTSEEAAAKVAELQAQIEALEATDPAFWNEMMQQEYDTLRLALGEAQTQYAELEEAERTAAATGSETAAQMQTEAEAYSNSAQELIDKFSEVYNNYAQKVGSWFAPYEQAKTTTVTSIEEMMAAMQSQIDFNQNYAANLQALKDYGLADLAAAFESYGAEGAVYAQTIVESIEQAGGSTSEGGQKIIDDFRTLDSEVANSQSDLAKTLTTMSGEFDESVAEIVTTVTQGVADIDKGTEAYNAAINTLTKYIEGVDKEMPNVLAKFTSLGQQITNSLQAAIGTITIKFKGSNVSGIPGFATGLDYVPYDNFIARLHKGEMVIPADQADYLRAGAFTEATTENNAAVVNLLAQILDAIQNGGTQETILKLNDRELGRAVRGYVYA